MGFAFECEMTPHVLKFLRSRGFLTSCQIWCGGWGICDIVAARFGLGVKRNIPECESLMALELKLDDVAGVMNQCRQNKAVVNSACAVMPRSRINRMRAGTVTSFDIEGIALLAVDDETGECQWCVEPEHSLPHSGWEDAHEKLVRKMWRYVRREYHAAKMGQT